MNKNYVIFISLFLLIGVGVAMAESNVINVKDWLKVSQADDYIEIAKGNVPGHSIVNKFGRNPDISTTLSHISISGEYQTPISPQSLEILSSSPLDTIGGTGGQQVVVIGLNGTFHEINETVNLTGTTPNQLTKQFMRVYRMYISQSGSYVTTGTPSHNGVLTLRNSGGGVTWVQIETIGGFGIGQSQIGTYTVPAGKTAFLLSKAFSVEANKPAAIYFFKREHSDDVVAPYKGTMRLFEQNDGIEVAFSIQTPAPLNRFPEKTEVGFFAIAQVGTASVSGEFQLLLVDNEYL